MKTVICVLGCVAVACIPGNVAAGPIFMGLGDLPGGQFRSQANAISADGSTIVGMSVSAMGEEAFRWTSADGMIGLGDLAGGAFRSTAVGVSAYGSFVVGASSSVNSGVAGEAFRWDSVSGMIGLGDLPGGFFSSGAVAVSADGSVIAGNGSGEQSEQAFRWTPETGITGLGFLPGGVSSRAWGMNSDGSIIVGGSSTNSTGGGGTAFRWTMYEDVHTFFHAEESTGATGVSQNGEFIVGALLGSSQAYIWSSLSGMVELGAFTPWAVSQNGSIVVGHRSGGGKGGPPSEAVIWHEVHGARFLVDVLTEDYDLELNGWHLTVANDISADGRVIVGYGGNPEGQIEAWVAVIPEPATLILCFMACGVVLRRRASPRMRCHFLVVLIFIYGSSEQVSAQWSHARGPVLIGGDDMDDHFEQTVGPDLIETGALYMRQGFDFLGARILDIDKRLT